MKMTTNRKLTLLALADFDVDDGPPHSAQSIAYTLENALKHQWKGFEALKSVPSKQQLHRTLRDLWRDGLIVGTRIKQDMCSALPCWVVMYQLSSEVESNHLVNTCNAMYRKVNKAKNGSVLFTSVFDMGLPRDEVKSLSVEVKQLLQRTHPDKVQGFDYQFQQMKQCQAWIKSGIPLPQA